jgi:hypothetical protein
LEHRRYLLDQLEKCWKVYGETLFEGLVGEDVPHNDHCVPPGWDQVEYIQCKVQRTPPGGGFCKMHYEQGNDIHCSRRFAVWMLYLNTVEKGGKTDFPLQGYSLQPTQGTLVFWPAGYTHPHRSAPDLEEYKYIVTGWLIYHADQYPTAKGSD